MKGRNSTTCECSRPKSLEDEACPRCMRLDGAAPFKIQEFSGIPKHKERPFIGLSPADSREMSLACDRFFERRNIKDV